MSQNAYSILILITILLAAACFLPAGWAVGVGGILGVAAYAGSVHRSLNQTKKKMSALQRENEGLRRLLHGEEDAPYRKDLTQEDIEDILAMTMGEGA